MAAERLWLSPACNLDICKDANEVTGRTEVDSARIFELGLVKQLVQPGDLGSSELVRAHLRSQATLCFCDKPACMFIAGLLSISASDAICGCEFVSSTSLWSFVPPGKGREVSREDSEGSEPAYSLEIFENSV